ncbi:ankyrin repeat domain-containing protein [Sporosarcina sp. PTS2304]|uniref:ankyrin repeat domain-containing protein n=1 Tax=Sporosarcina sp. PTS2304 TaxID=2283194 RepID=UPI0013B3D322|nr:ankyrin repeat domain-containing protein [Sporosarcina sp. PTS2304]
MKCPLIAPASNGDIEQIEKLLKNGQYMQKTDENGRTPLMFAVFFNHFETAEHLLERKICDINHQDHYGNTALMFAVNADHVDIVLLLQVYGADLYIRNKQEQHAYFIANRRRKASEAYISPPGTGSAKKYPDVKKKETMITWAVKAESIRLLKFVMRKQLFNTETLYETVRVLLSRPTSDLLSAILPILEVRAIINYFEEDSIHYRSTVDMRQTLFMHACASSRMENVQRLLENGADPTIIANANHAMLVAMKNKRMGVVTLILDHLQNDVSCYDDFFQYIFENDYSEVLKELVDRGISADYMYKSVPLIIWATTNRAKACLKVLLEKGANPNAGHPYTALAEVDFQPKKLSEIELKFRSSLNESVEIMKRFAEEKEFVGVPSEKCGFTTLRKNGLKTRACSTLNVVLLLF